MDEAVRVPGTGLRVGLDGLLGLVPGVGDLGGALVSAWFLVTAARLGAPPSLLLRMAGNVAADALVGSVPVVGDLFDLAWKANRRNLRLLEAHLADPAAARRSSRWVVGGALAAALAAVTLAAAGALALAAALVRLVVGAAGG